MGPQQALVCALPHSFEYLLSSQNEYLNIWMGRKCKLALHIFPYVTQYQVNQLMVSSHLYSVILILQRAELH